ncbi:diguanylate cyclase, partial [Ideonella sp.]|uniref:diguanylate cyclase n=1 Tax=Ideonella sp. TaxID=1929293 RepID=UPI003BB6964D
PAPALVSMVRSASPLMVAGTLLLVSLFLIAIDYRAGAAGVVFSVMGYALRNVLAQMSFIAQGEVDLRERRELESLAWTDALTGVANRRFLEHALRGAWWREQRGNHAVAALMIDIDHFKALNDRYGHEAGDQCLREVASALQKALVRPGDMLARYGGEEFVALLQETDVEGAQVVAERMRAAVEHLGMHHPGSASGVVTVSIGMASAPLRDEQSSLALIRMADKALYVAKCAGRNRVASAEAPHATEAG